jgi:multidrug efflux system membrane fusion protein
MSETSRRDEDQHKLPAPEPQKALPAPASSGAGSVIRKILLVAVLVAAGVLIYFRIQNNKKDSDAATQKTAQAANRAIPVTVSTVQAKTMPIYITALGTVTAYNTVTIKSRVDGQLLSVNVREGQQVRQGQLLAMIDPRPYEAIVAQAKGQLAKDQASADYAKAEAGRYTALYQAGVVSKESEQTQVSSAGASAGTLDADRAAIQAAEVNVAYTKITSPINGVVGLRQVDAGNIVHASDANGLVVLTQLQPIAVIFTMPEDQLPQVLKMIRGGRKLVVEAYDRSQATKLATGSLLTLDNEIDTTTGTVKAKAVFDNKDGALFPNQFVNVRLILEERQNALVLPAAGVQSGTTGNFVYLVKPGNPPAGAGGKKGGGGAKPAATAPDAAPATTSASADAGGEDAAAPGAAAAPKRKPYYVVAQPVVVDLTEGSQVILKSGVKPGDEVVTDGQEKLKPNSKVDPRTAPTGAGAGAAAAASADTGADGSTPNPDTGQGGLDEPRGKHGSHGPGTTATGADAAPAADGAHHHKRPQP